MNATNIPFHVTFTLERAMERAYYRTSAMRMYGPNWAERVPEHEAQERQAVADRLRSILGEIGPRERVLLRCARRAMKAGAR